MEDRIVGNGDVMDSLSRSVGDVDDLDAVGCDLAPRYDCPPPASTVAETEALKRGFEEIAASFGATVEWGCDVRADRNLPFWYQDDMVCRLRSPEYTAELQTTSPIVGYVDGAPYDDDGESPWAVVSDFNLGCDADAAAQGIALDYTYDYFYWVIRPTDELFQSSDIYAVDSSDYGLRENTLKDALGNGTIDSDICDVIAQAYKDPELGITNQRIALGESSRKRRAAGKRKAPKGASLIDNAGDVEANVAHFNMAIGSAGPCSESAMEEAPEKHHTLNGKLWNIDDNTLKPEVKEKIDAVVEDFCDGLDDNEVKYKLADVRLVGSNCSYNYTDKSDLDVHIVFDLSIYGDDEKERMAETIYNYARSLWGKTHSVEFYGIPVEVFVETNNTVDLNVGGDD